MLTIAISTAKGGTTKTTTAVNLACGLARRGLRVLLADLDSQGHASMLLDDGTGSTAPGQGVDAVLQGHKGLADVAWQGRFGVQVACAPRADVGAPVLEQLNMWLGTQLRREQILARALAKVEGDYDVVVLDCPPARNALVENALFAADWIICPVALNSLHYHGIQEVANFAEFVAGSRKPLSVLVSLYRSSCVTMNRCTLDTIDTDVDAGQYERFDVRIPFTTDLDKAIHALQPIYEAAPNSGAARAYEALVDEVAEMIPQTRAA